MVVLPGLCLVLKLLSLGAYNYVPAGLTVVVFAVLSVWTTEIPDLYRYKLLATSADARSPDAKGVTLSDKSTTYLLAAQLALSQFPYSVLPAAVGWVVGTAWQSDLLPGGMARWRVPRWVIGESAQVKERGQYEGLRRRLEQEGSAGDGMRHVADQAQEERSGSGRGFLGQVGRYFSGS